MLSLDTVKSSVNEALKKHTEPIRAAANLYIHSRNVSTVMVQVEVRIEEQYFKSEKLPRLEYQQFAYIHEVSSKAFEPLYPPKSDMEARRMILDMQASEEALANDILGIIQANMGTQILEWQKLLGVRCPRCNAPTQTYSATRHYGQMLPVSGILMCHCPNCKWEGTLDG